MYMLVRHRLELLSFLTNRLIMGTMKAAGKGGASMGVESMEKSDYLKLPDERLAMLSQEGNDAARDQLMEKYKGFVKARARTYFLIGADREDIIQEGMIGLYKAIRDYKSDKPASFRAFAELCITRQMITAVKTATRQKHIPLNSYISLNKPVYDEENERTLLDTITEENHFDPEEIMITKEHLGLMEEKMVQSLSHLERNVMSLYLDGQSYIEIARRLKKSEKSIDNALQRVKRKVEKFIQETADA